MANEPAYIKIKNYFIEKINNGFYEEDSLLPSERNLSIKFNVSRMTARKAVDQLVKEGYVERIERKGTYVKKNKIIQNSSVLSGFSSMLKRQGYKSNKSIIIENKELTADKDLAEKLNIKPNEKVSLIGRIRCIEDEPLAVEYAYLPSKMFPGILDIDFSQRSLYETIENVYNTKIFSGEQIISVGFSDEKISKYLEIENGYPVVINNGPTYNDNGSIIEYLLAYYRIDRCSFYSMLRREDDSNLGINIKVNKQ